MPYDVFISYPRVNDFLKQWVSAFGRDLEDKLREKTAGGHAQIFLDTSEVGIGPLRQIVSPRHFKRCSRSVEIGRGAKPLLAGIAPGIEGAPTIKINL